MEREMERERKSRYDVESKYREMERKQQAQTTTIASPQPTQAMASASQSTQTSTPASTSIAIGTSTDHASDADIETDTSKLLLRLFRPIITSSALVTLFTTFLSHFSHHCTTLALSPSSLHTTCSHLTLCLHTTWHALDAQHTYIDPAEHALVMEEMRVLRATMTSTQEQVEWWKQKGQRDMQQREHKATTADAGIQTITAMASPAPSPHSAMSVSRVHALDTPQPVHHHPVPYHTSTSPSRASLHLPASASTHTNISLVPFNTDTDVTLPDLSTHTSFAEQQSHGTTLTTATTPGASAAAATPQSTLTPVRAHTRASASTPKALAPVKHTSPIAPVPSSSRRSSEASPPETIIHTHAERARIGHTRARPRAKARFNQHGHLLPPTTVSVLRTPVKSPASPSHVSFAVTPTSTATDTSKSPSVSASRAPASPSSDTHTVPSTRTPDKRSAPQATSTPVKTPQRTPEQHQMQRSPQQQHQHKHVQHQHMPQEHKYARDEHDKQQNQYRPQQHVHEYENHRHEHDKQDQQQQQQRHQYQQQSYEQDEQDQQDERVQEKHQHEQDEYTSEHEHEDGHGYDSDAQQQVHSQQQHEHESTADTSFDRELDASTRPRHTVPSTRSHVHFLDGSLSSISSMSASIPPIAPVAASYRSDTGPSRPQTRDVQHKPITAAHVSHVMPSTVAIPLSRHHPNISLDDELIADLTASHDMSFRSEAATQTATTALPVRMLHTESMSDSSMSSIASETAHLIAAYHAETAQAQAQARTHQSLYELFTRSQPQTHAHPTRAPASTSVPPSPSHDVHDMGTSHDIKHMFEQEYRRFQAQATHGTSTAPAQAQAQAHAHATRTQLSSRQPPQQPVAALYRPVSLQHEQQPQEHKYHVESKMNGDARPSVSSSPSPRLARPASPLATAAYRPFSLLSTPDRPRMRTDTDEHETWQKFPFFPHGPVPVTQQHGRMVNTPLSNGTSGRRAATATV